MPGKPFEKNDPRINRSGRPKGFPDLRKLMLKIFNEPATGAEGRPITRDGHALTNIEFILRQWMVSKNPRLQMAAVEIGYGKVPDELIITQPLDSLPDAALNKLAEGKKP